MVLFVVIFWLFLWDRIFLCSLSCSRTHYVDTPRWTGTHGGLPASASRCYHGSSASEKGFRKETNLHCCCTAWESPVLFSEIHKVQSSQGPLGTNSSVGHSSSSCKLLQGVPEDLSSSLPWKLPLTKHLLRSECWVLTLQHLSWSSQRPHWGGSPTVPFYNEKSGHRENM